jgi:DNA-binding Lrp family transcriptional regulator
MVRETVDVDAFDLKLLAALQENGAASSQDLADRVGLSASQCARRRLRLEQAGIIRSYRAVLDAERLGWRTAAFIAVTLSSHSRANSRSFRDLVARTPPIQEAHVLTGDTDYLLKVVVRDLAALSALVNDVLLQHESIARVRSNIVLETLKDENRLPLA